MTKHYIGISGKWAVILAYGISESDWDEVEAWLEALGCSPREMRRAHRVIMQENSGFTISSARQRMSVVCISRTTSIEQWWDTLVHELKHVQSHVCDYYDVPDNGEDASYLIGYMMREIVARKIANGSMCADG